MKATKKRKDVKKAVLLALCPGLGFLYLENMAYWLLFAFLCVMPLALIATAGKTAFLICGLLYGLSIYYTYVLATETLRNNEMYKKDPYYVLCLSVLVDGLGQIYLKQNKKGYIMMLTGLTNCLIVLSILIYKNGFIEMCLSAKGTSLYTITNMMIVWLIVSGPIKIISLIDAYYSTYHLYVAKK